ncbi:DNA double-strand break repair nuclease NurA [Candidatus Nitrososphaera sp. FF02]|uniref:DNA double-strand break repair nuclease NurA n=1 Tax=Candidatus Nitrososphaera sp. FF02 TaxID=3398226 RepID=UPI0039EA67C0
MATQLNPPSSISLGDFGIFESVSRCLTPKLDELRGKKILFSSDDKSLVPVGGWGARPQSYCATITTFRPIRENTMVAAIDSSSIKVAETEEGTLYAIKCGVAMAYGGAALMHFKIGPMLFYLSESTVFDSELDDRLARLVLVDSDVARRLVRVRAERAIQHELSQHMRNSLILVDGSLRTSVFEDRNRSMAKIAENCVLHKNMIVGISKNTKLKVLERAAAPLAKVPGPAYIDVDVIIKSLIRGSVGSNMMAKFDKNTPVLRVDVVGDREQALGRLLGNDPVACGYPETLRLAHHISTFTGTEVTCLRSHVLNNYDVMELAADDIRHTLLGSIMV